MIGAIRDTLGWVLGHLYGGIGGALVRGAGRWHCELLPLGWLESGTRPTGARCLINLPISLIALVLTWWAPRGVKQERSGGRFDWLGTPIIGALTALVLGLGANIEVSADTTTFEEVGGCRRMPRPC